jgi:hypothetical protein
MPNKFRQAIERFAVGKYGLAELVTFAIKAHGPYPFGPVKML